MTDATEHEIVTVRWEPCPAFHEDPDAADGCCTGCGWSSDDHDAAPLAA